VKVQKVFCIQSADQTQTCKTTLQIINPGAAHVPEDPSAPPLTSFTFYTCSFLQKAFGFPGKVSHKHKERKHKIKNLKMKFLLKIFKNKSSKKEKDLKILCLKQQEELLKIREEMKLLQEKYNEVNQRIFKANAPQRRRTFPDDNVPKMTRTKISNSDPLHISHRSL